MKKHIHCLFVFVLVISLFACHRKSKFALDNNFIPEDIRGTEATFKANAGQVARQITYDIIVKNNNPYDTWTTTCLQGFDRNDFVDEIFQSIYDGKLKAIDYATDKKLSVKKVRALEKEILKIRNRIAKIQFTEDWYLDTTSLTMQKQVHSMVLGYEIYNDSGQVRGYRPAFKINLNTR